MGNTWRRQWGGTTDPHSGKIARTTRGGARHIWSWAEEEEEGKGDQVASGTCEEMIPLPDLRCVCGDTASARVPWLLHTHTQRAGR